MPAIMHVPDRFSDIDALKHGARPAPRGLASLCCNRSQGALTREGRMPDVAVDVTVNGVSRCERVPARTLLVHFLRDNLRLTGTHVGCDTTQCGACTVALDGVAVKSCTILAAQADGHEVTTIEGLADTTEDGGDPADDTLDPVQRAFKDEHALQCGYCTPGMVMAVRQ